jgi:hypothetical protein
MACCKRSSVASSPPAAVRSPWKRVLRVVALSLATGAVGCGSNVEHLPYPTSGTVTRNGQPLEGVELVFFARDEANNLTQVPAPQGKSDSSGRFQLSTFAPGDGAPAGAYGVAAVWMKVTQPADDPEQIVEVDQFNGRYANHESSGLTAEIAEGDNILPPFDLP